MCCIYATIIVIKNSYIMGTIFSQHLSKKQTKEEIEHLNMVKEKCRINKENQIILLKIFKEEWNIICTVT